MAAGDLTDLESVRTLLRLQSGDATTSDELLAYLITAASDEIKRFTGRELVPIREPEAREFVAGGPIVDLAPCDLRQATRVERVDSPTSATTLSSYRLRPKPSRYGVYSWMEVDGLRRGDEIRITGLWGFPQVPDFVRHWAGMTVVLWKRMNIEAFSQTFELHEGRVQRPESLPSAVRSALRDLRRRPV